MHENATLAKSQPRLHRSQLSFRIGLCRGRTAAYPMHKLDFIMMDLERPVLSHRHADWCAGDLSGRVLEFLSAAEGVDGQSDPRLETLFQRILRTQRPSGLFGRYASEPRSTEPPESDILGGGHRLFNGLLRYYDLTGDWRALEAAAGIGDWYVKNRDWWRKEFSHNRRFGLFSWITEPLANLYGLTGERNYLDMVAQVAEPLEQIESAHSHGTLTTLRGLQQTALHTDDPAWNEKPERFRREIIDRRYEMPDGCIAEVFPHGFRNEGCSIADWVMLNLNAGLLTGDDECYEIAENALWNALFYNQFVTGGFGHRDLTACGYAMGPMSECWWCCTENGGMAMSEYARHAVSLRGQNVSVNLLVPGEFRVPKPGGEILVDIRTSYPAGAEATITVRGLPSDFGIKLRAPNSLKQARVAETRSAQQVQLRLTGRIGHHLQSCGDNVLLRYGPVVLAPMIYYWNTEDRAMPSNAPPGYVPGFLPPGLPRLLAGQSDADGLLALRRDPPDWIFFEQGPDAELSVEGATAYVDAIFKNGETRELWFSPLCHNTSAMTYFETPIVFPR